MRRVLAAWGVAVIALTGCSSGGDKAATTTSASVGPVTTMRPVDTSFTGQNSTEFCAQARTYNDRFSSVGANPTPAELRTVVKEGQTAIGQAVSSAPAEIKNDVVVIADTFNAFLGELDKVNYDVLKLPPTALQALSTPEFQQSTTRFQSYIRTVCGVTG